MQEFRVVQCCECKVLQVDIVKKAKKWACKACNQNQVVKRIYFKSYAGKFSLFTLENFFLETHMQDFCDFTE